MGRKTVDIETVKEMVNRGLETSSSTLYLEGLTPEQAFRTGLTAVLEQVLMSTGNYKGFAYQRSELQSDGTLKPDYDNTRRKYY
jgi:hypothetical protein